MLKIIHSKAENQPLNSVHAPSPHRPAPGVLLAHLTGQEVDFVLETRQGELTGIEVKAAVSLGASDFKGLRHLQETEPERFRRGYVLYAGQEVVAFGSGLWGVPLGMWWGAAP